MLRAVALALLYHFAQQLPPPQPAPPQKPPTHEETVVVEATRTRKRLEDVPVRVEVLEREEIEEKMLMTPGDIVMMLNEMGGLRVQATSPSLGAESVSVQGMRGDRKRTSMTYSHLVLLFTVYCFINYIILLCSVL